MEASYTATLRKVRRYGSEEYLDKKTVLSWNLESMTSNKSMPEDKLHRPIHSIANAEFCNIFQ